MRWHVHRENNSFEFGITWIVILLISKSNNFPQSCMFVIQLCLRNIHLRQALIVLLKLRSLEVENVSHYDLVNMGSLGGDNPKLSECDLYHFSNLASKSRISSAVVIIITLKHCSTLWILNTIFRTHIVANTSWFSPCNSNPIVCSHRNNYFMPKIEET